MTMENNRQDLMLIGHHFGKRKPQWNFFIRSYERFKFSTSAPLARLVIFSFIVQMAFYFPVIYWIYQNYAIIEKVLPAHLNLQENIQFEKKWIVFLMLGMTLIQSFWNFYIWKVFIRSERYPFPEAINRESAASPDEVDYQRRAS
jgi:hypothetical protein